MVSHVARWSGSLLPRAHWLGTVAAGALSLAFGGTALAGPNACTTSGAVATCTGNQSAGIASGVDFTAPPVTTLNVNNLTQAIAPASGIDGVEFNSAAAITITSNTGSFGITTQGTNAIGIYAFTTGAGAVTVTSTGNINTQGTSATGILAQSLGAGNVTVTSTGNIATQGTDATGIFAESISAGATVTSTGNITTQGASASGIVAQSLGAGTVTVTSTGDISTRGSGATGIAAYSNAGAVTVTSTGKITTVGSNASGIYARGTGGPITVTINSGTVSGGSGSGAGVTLFGGTNNTVTNRGTVTALSGLAIQGSGNNTVNNFGTVIGNVILGTGTNAFNNMAGGLFDAGTTVNLGAGNVLSNAGTLSPGGAGVIQTTALTGNLTQSATGILFSDINITGATLRPGQCIRHRQSGRRGAGAGVERDTRTVAADGAVGRGRHHQ